MNSKKNITAFFAASMKYAKVILYVISFMSFISIFGGAQITSGIVSGLTGQNPSAGALQAICTIYNDVQTIIFILGLTLMILGAAMYAGSHVMPSQSKGSLQGYGMGMVIGGFVGVVIALIAPYLLELITGATAAQITSSCGISSILGGF